MSALVAILGLVSAVGEDSTVAEKLKGKLIQVKDGEVVEAAITGAPEYYVLYHSASW